MSSGKTKNTLFRRNRKSEGGPSVEPTPARESIEPPAETPASNPAPAATPSRALPPTGYRGAEHINADATRDIGDLKKNTFDGIRGDVQKDIGGISPGLHGLLTPSEKKDNYGHELPQKGGHFLEPNVSHLHEDFIERWKRELLFPNIQNWVDVYLVDYIQNLLHKRTEAIIAKFEETIAQIEEKHKQEIIELERAHKELLVTVVKKTWGDYEKKLQNSKVVKQVHFGFHPSAEKEPWGEDIHDVVPEVMEHVPRVYEPDVSLEDHPDHPSGGGHHTRHHSHHHGKHVADPAAETGEGHDREGTFT